MSAIEIETAIRNLPAEEAKALLDRLERLCLPAGKPGALTDEVIAKWRDRFRFPDGVSTTDEYLKLIRGGDRD